MPPIILHNLSYPRSLFPSFPFLQATRGRAVAGGRQEFGEQAQRLRRAHLLPPILELGPVCAPFYRGVNGGKGGNEQTASVSWANQGLVPPTLFQASPSHPLLTLCCHSQKQGPKMSG